MSKDINITIGAEDAASKVLKQVERSTEKVTKSVDKMAKVSEVSSKTVSFAFGGLAKAVTIAGAAIVAIKGVTSAIAGLSGSVDAFNEQEEAARGMTQAQLDFASALQVATNLGDESTLALMRQAEMLGVTKDQTDEVALSVAGLSEALGIGQEEALKTVTQAMSGSTAAMNEKLPALRAIDEAAKAGTGAFEGLTAAEAKSLATTQKLAAISEVAGRGLNKLQEDAQSTKGIMERSAGAFGDLQEKIGALLEPIFRVTHLGLAVFAETLQIALGPAIDNVRSGVAGMQPVVEAIAKAFGQAAVVIGVWFEAATNIIKPFFSVFNSEAGGTMGILEGIQHAFRTLAEVAITVLTAQEVFWANLGSVVDLAVTVVLLRIEQMRAGLEHVFTQIIPAYVKWFGENAFNLLQDYFSLYTTVLSNFGKKLASFWTTIFDFISSGFEGGVSGLASQLGEALSGSLIEGFEAKTKPLPDVVGRSLTDREQELANKAGSLANGLADEFNMKLQDRLADLDVNVNGNVEIDTPDLSKISQDLTAKVETQTMVKVQELTAQDQRLLNRGPGEDPNRMVAENTKRLVEQNRQLPEQIAQRLAPLVGNDSNTLQFVEVA